MITRKLPKAHASAVPITVDAKERTVSVTLSTGAMVKRIGWNGPYNESLSIEPSSIDLSRLEGGPLLSDHKNEIGSIIGRIESVRVENGALTAVARFAPDEASLGVFEKVRSGFIKSLSIGYRIDEMVDVTTDSDSIPHYKVTRFTPFEASAVAVPADNSAVFRSEETMFPVNILTNRVQNSNHIEVVPMSKKEILPSAEVLAERQRSTEIRTLVREAKLDDKAAEEFISRGATVEEARDSVAMIAKYAKQEPINSTTLVAMGTDEVDKKRDAAVQALVYRMDSKITPTQGNPFLNQNLLRIMESFIPRQWNESESRYATRAMSSSDLPYILANSGEKAALAKYQAAPASYRLWSVKRTLRNFKTADLLRSGDFAGLLERQEGAEFKQMAMGEEREQVALKEFGAKMAFSRRMLINDDLGEIQRVIAQAGQGAAMLENALVYAVLTGNPDMGDGNPLFDAAHANVATGAALTDLEIAEAIQIMRAQESVDGRYKLNLSPSYLLCGPLNEILARKYLAQIYATQSTNVNAVSGSMEVIVDSEISSNDYFFAASPQAIESVAIFNLEGEEQPRVESRTDFNTESVEVKLAHSCVAKALDWRGLVKNDSGS